MSPMDRSLGTLCCFLPSCGKWWDLSCPGEKDNSSFQALACTGHGPGRLRLPLLIYWCFAEYLMCLGFSFPFRALSRRNMAGKRIFGVFLSTATVYIAERWRIQTLTVDRPGVWSQLCCLTSWLSWQLFNILSAFDKEYCWLILVILSIT